MTRKNVSRHGGIFDLADNFLFGARAQKTETLETKMLLNGGKTTITEKRKAKKIKVLGLKSLTQPGPKSESIMDLE